MDSLSGDRLTGLKYPDLAAVLFLHWFSAMKPGLSIIQSKI
jgi:hypothetical protein